MEEWKRLTVNGGKVFFVLFHSVYHHLCMFNKEKVSLVIVLFALALVSMPPFLT